MLVLASIEGYNLDCLRQTKADLNRGRRSYKVAISKRGLPVRSAIYSVSVDLFGQSIPKNFRLGETIIHYINLFVSFYRTPNSKFDVYKRKYRFKIIFDVYSLVLGAIGPLTSIVGYRKKRPSTCKVSCLKLFNLNP